MKDAPFSLPLNSTYRVLMGTIRNLSIKSLNSINLVGLRLHGRTTNRTITPNYLIMGGFSAKLGRSVYISSTEMDYFLFK